MQHLLKAYDSLGTSDKIAIAIGLASIIIGVIAAIAGALFGSLSAYMLARNQQKRDLNASRFSALLIAQYALISQFEILRNVNAITLDPIRNEPNGYLFIKMVNMPELHLSVSLKDIAFIAETQSADLLRRIHQAEQAYLSSINQLANCHEENEILRNNPEYKIVATDIESGIQTVNAPKAALAKYKIAIDNLFLVVDDAIPLLEKQIKALADYIRATYPEQNAFPINLDRKKKGSPA